MRKRSVSEQSRSDESQSTGVASSESVELGQVPVGEPVNVEIIDVGALERSILEKVDRKIDGLGSQLQSFLAKWAAEQGERASLSGSTPQAPPPHCLF